MSTLGQKTIALTIHKWINYLLIFLVATVLLYYVYLANTTVRIVTALEKTKIETQNLNISVSELESKRLTLENGINTERALQLGFVPVNNPIFIIKTQAHAALSLKD